MAARALSSGTIAFGLVSIPVKLYTAVSPSDGVRFNTLHQACGTRVKQQFFCPQCEVVVGREDTMKGYEFSKGKYVKFSSDELKAVEEQSSGGIDITEFVPITQVDPIYYAKAYYLGPDQGAGRAYQLLAEALRRTGLVGLAKYAARGKQYLVLLRPAREGLIMQQLHYPEEVRSMTDIGIDQTIPDESELELAIRLVQQGAAKTFAPDRYHDEVKDRIESLIRQKVDGQDITAATPAVVKSEVIDLMAALKQSLASESSAASGS